jgi:L-iditol 2-dehydrogenase
MAVEAGAEIVAMTDAEAIDAVEGGVDVVVECSGNPGAEDLAPRLCRRWGRTVFVGIPHAPVKLGQETFERVLRYELVLRGSWNSYSAPFPGPEWRETLRCLANGDLRWKFMVTHDVGLDALPEIFRGLGSRDLFSAKVIFRPNLVEG